MKGSLNNDKPWRIIEGLFFSAFWLSVGFFFFFFRRSEAHIPALYSLPPAPAPLDLVGPHDNPRNVEKDIWQITKCTSPLLLLWLNVETRQKMRSF